MLFKFLIRQNSYWFLYEIQNPQNEEIKGYIYDNPHLADREMNLIAQDPKITELFRSKTTKKKASYQVKPR